MLHHCLPCSHRPPIYPAEQEQLNSVLFILTHTPFPLQELSIQGSISVSHNSPVYSVPHIHSNREPLETQTPLFTHGSGEQGCAVGGSVVREISQRDPVCVALHAQKNDPSVLIHTPAVEQGDEVHSFTSLTQSEPANPCVQEQEYPPKLFIQVPLF